MSEPDVPRRSLLDLLGLRLVLAAVWLLLYCAAFSAFLVLHPLHGALFHEVVAGGTVVGPMVILGLCLTAGTSSARHMNNVERVAVLLSLGALTASLSRALWVIFVHTVHPPPIPPGWVGLSYSATYPLWLAAILLMPRAATSFSARLRLTVEGLIVMAVAFTFSWYFTLGPSLLSSHGSGLPKIIGTAYPLGDLALLACVILLFSRPHDHTLRLMSATLVPGFVAIITSDSLFDLRFLHPGYQPGAVAGVLWPIGTMLVSLAALVLLQIQRNAAAAEFVLSSIRPSHPDVRNRVLKSILPYVFVPAVCALLIYVTLVHYAPRYLPGVIFGSLTVVVLILIRQMIAVVENARLSEQLETKVEELAQANEKLSELASTDPLTELPNHRAMVITLDSELERAERYERPISVLFMDLDRFKSVNDYYGHRGGDSALRELSAAAKTVLRSVDYIGRWGGEEFVAVLPETDGPGAVIVAERIRTALADHRFALAPEMRITCSIGISTFPADAATADDLISLADEAMYAAKWLGRNQVRAITDHAVQVVVEERSHEARRDEAAITATVEALASLVDARDNYTGLHAVFVASLGRRIAGLLGLSWEEIALIDLAGRLHDIGKVAVPDAILLKPGKLTSEEWQLMRSHPAVGADVVSRIPRLQALAPIVRAHHERFDGNGYPDGLMGDNIPIGARIISVADSYSAMITERPYKGAMTEVDAVAELRRCSGSQFDPDVVRALETLIAVPAVQALAS